MRIKYDDYIGKAVRFKSNGYESQLWVIIPEGGNEIKADIKLNPTGIASIATPAGETPDEAGLLKDRILRSQKINQQMRLVLASYQAITLGKTELAKNLAKQARTIDPEIAAPLIIEAMAFLKEGTNDKAKVLLEQAKILDAGDSNITRLLEAIP